MEQGALVQGVILLGTQKFVRERFGPDFWRMVETDVNIAGRLFLPSQEYPMSEVDAVIGSVSRHSGMSVPLVLESIGDYIAPDMFGAYANLLDPQWNLLDILLHGEKIVERAALKRGIKLVNTPIQGRAGSNGEMILAYRNSWRICQLIKGLVRGLGAHMNQPVNIEEIRCALMGSPSCEFTVKVEKVRPARQRMASVPERLGLPKFMDGERADRGSSMPPSRASRPDARSTPGLAALPQRVDPTGSPIPSEPGIPTSRKSNLPPPPDSDIGSADHDLLGNRRR